jgi:transcriptional regulator of acetoin/glycerol metabolism
MRIAADTAARLLAYRWPGNVRELRNQMEYAFAVGDGPILAGGDLLPEIADPAAEPSELEPQANLPPELPAASGEAARIRRALERAGGNRDRAARSLGLSRATLWRRMKALGLL